MGHENEFQSIEISYFRFKAKIAIWWMGNLCLALEKKNKKKKRTLNLTKPWEHVVNERMKEKRK